LWDDAAIEAWRRVAVAAHEGGARIAAVLAHAGRRAAVDAPVAASPLAYGDAPVPRALAVEEIDASVGAHAAAARRAVTAGVDAIALDAAGGGLLAGFVSPLTNRRDDGHGVTADGRARFLLAVVEAIRAAIGDRPLLVRLALDDGARGGLIPDEAAALARRVHAAGASMIVASAGGLVPGADPPIARLAGVRWTDRLRNEVGVPVALEGGLQGPDDLDGVLAAGRADLGIVGSLDPVDLRSFLSEILVDAGSAAR
jgi:anthraniloyl-CoA monooxygenase